MPNAAKKPCRQPGCGALLDQSGFCDVHKKAAQARQDAQRGTAHQRGYGYKWQQASKGYLAAHPLCECEECVRYRAWWSNASAATDADGNVPDAIRRTMPLGEIRAATVVDHIKPHKGDMRLFWQRSNWQAMSKPCHDKKTASEDGGFGRIA